MSGRGRKANHNFSKLMFSLLKENNKYYAKCFMCEKNLSNTSASRLQLHRNVCPLNIKMENQQVEGNTYNQSDVYADQEDKAPAPKPNHERIKLEYYGMEDDDDEDDDFLPLSLSSKKKEQRKMHRQSHRKSVNSSDHPSPPKKPSGPTQASINARIDVDNEFELFGKSIAVQLKKMPLDRALICQEKLQQVMTQERLNQMQKRGETTDINIDDPLT